MFTIVGLRNPGATYQATRHNAGAIAAAAFAERSLGVSFHASRALQSDVAEGVIAGKEVRVLLPQTYMNHSGVAVQKALTDADASPEELVVVYDDLDLPIGSFKVSRGRGSGGHNGVRSVIDAAGTPAFTRVRIGISPVSLFGTMRRPAGAGVADFVLKDFSRRERAKLDALLPQVTEALTTIVTQGTDEAMNRFN